MTDRNTEPVVMPERAPAKRLLYRPTGSTAGMEFTADCSTWVVHHGPDGGEPTT